MFIARKTVQEMQDALATALRRLDDLERARKSDLLELDDMYEKTRRVLGRISKREQRATQEEEPGDNGEPPCLDPVTARVMAFRKARHDVLGKP